MDTQETPKKTRRRKVAQPPSEKVELVVEEPLPIPENTPQNKYAPKKKIGANKAPNVVTTVGLGKLKVETVKGYADA